MDSKSKDIAKDLEVIKSTVKEEKLKKAIEEKQAYVNKPIKK